MSLDAFLESLSSGDCPALLPPLRALWFDAKGDWNAAHKCVDDKADPESMWVHAYLHRKEGDLSNAAYWYRRAGQEPHKGPLEEEWREIAEALLSQTAP
ncbi:hypothetical protein [Methylocystis rosea]|uniref:Sel1 repeat family protein n=1 Tax=Methylocystis rosea TaxID=173366 RepID=A0A3G8M7K9_9HYPH|nr:hypothetical protein [Methylocystis rosea]AZG77891.1 hypothetical protein EHO51_14755 [Methylocystis rosea]